MVHMRVPTVSILESLNDIESSILNPVTDFEYIASKAINPLLWPVGRDFLDTLRLLLS